jgi:hypothetical protein
MTQEEKYLLLNDLCARLLYEVKCKDITLDFVGTMMEISMHDNMCRLFNDYGDNYTCFMVNCKPYLFPLSSMTDEQKEEYENITFKDGFLTVWTTSTYDWFNKNHFDYRGLIKKGLAIDATGLNIY